MSGRWQGGLAWEGGGRVGGRGVESRSFVHSRRACVLFRSPPASMSSGLVSRDSLSSTLGPEGSREQNTLHLRLRGDGSGLDMRVSSSSQTTK